MHSNYFKKILFVTQTLDVTGSEIALKNILDNCDLQKFECKVLIYHQPGLLAASPKAGIELFFLNLYRKKLFVRAGAFFLKLLRFAKSFSLWQSIFGSNFLANDKIDQIFLRKILRRHSIDLVYFNGIMFPTLMEYCAGNSIPYILHTHELEHIFFYLEKKNTSALISFPRLIIATSHASANAIRTLGYRDRIEIWNPCIDFEKMNIPSPRRVNRKNANRKHFQWFGIGYNDFNKNIALFVKTAAAIISRGILAEFTWIGLKSDRLYDDWVIEYAKNLGIENQIHFMGKFDYDKEYYNLLSTADAFMIPSFKESFSLSAIEAIYLGKPVLTFDNGGAKEYISKQNGIIVPNYDYDSYLKNAIRIMRNRNQYKRNKMISSVKKFDIKDQIVSWQTLISGAIHPQNN